MSSREPTRTAQRRYRSTVVAAFTAAIAVLVLVLLCQSLTSSSSAAAPSADVRGDHVPAVIGVESVLPAPDLPRLEGDHDRLDGTRRAQPLGEEGGAVPEGVTVFDDEFPGVANLDPGLLDAVRRATLDAADDGVEIVVNSGWRSAEYQDHLLDEATHEHGSEEEAARWVATADTSAHVSGDAIDVGPSDARRWLSEHGDEYGLCQIYGNEPWHFELRPEATRQGCPATYADPTHDPRMQQ